MESPEIKQWKDEGYTVIGNLLDKEILVNSKECLSNLYENGELSTKDFGSNGKLDFPSNTILDQISINEKIIKCVQNLLGTEEVLLIQSDAWGKRGHSDYSEQSNNDQRMHMDYGNNTFLHPSEWDKPEAVAMIIYLSDVKQTLGGTSLVTRNGKDDKAYEYPYINMPGQNKHPFINDKTNAEKYFEENNPEIYNFRKNLYQREQILTPNFGDILFYRLDLWHRGTPVKEGEIRFVMNLLWKKKECFWINCWNPGWTKWMYYGHSEQLFTDMTPLQRSVLGIPLPGDNYWNLETIQLLKARYPNIDTDPYINTLNRNNNIC